MLKQIPLISFLLILFACNTSTTQNISTNQPSEKDTTTRLNILFDTHNEKMDTNFLSVYQFSPTLIAMTVDLDVPPERESELATIYYKIEKAEAISIDLFDKLTNCYLYDSSGEFTFYKNNVLEDEIKKHISKEYYVYGTKGIQKCEVSVVIFSLNECSSNIMAITLQGFDTLKYGHPLMCSAKETAITYQNNYTDVENIINSIPKSSQGDFTDDIKTNVFANYNYFYFTYSDDFNWNKKSLEQHACLYPYRSVVTIQQYKTVATYWGGTDMDLFGIRCL